MMLLVCYTLTQWEMDLDDSCNTFNHILWEARVLHLILSSPWVVHHRVKQTPFRFQLLYLHTEINSQPLTNILLHPTVDSFQKIFQHQKMKK